MDVDRLSGTIPVWENGFHLPATVRGGMLHERDASRLGLGDGLHNLETIPPADLIVSRMALIVECKAFGFAPGSPE